MMIRAFFRRNSSYRDYLIGKVFLYVSFAYVPFIVGVIVGLLFSVAAIKDAADYVDAHYICQECK